ncbi:MAG: hypothetical protein ACI4AD_11880 [Roseburia sp.]
MEMDKLQKGLEEASFYFKLSRDKKEDEKYDEEPTYYLKAQDILLDLSTQYPDDYRIWWELCKPVDFYNPLSGADFYGRYAVNEDYFWKALDRAELEDKRRLIDEHDRYVECKKNMREQAERKSREEQELQERALEEREREKEKWQEETVQTQQELSSELWQMLWNRDYTRINNTFFNLPLEDERMIVGVFKDVAQVMYLMTFRIDGRKEAVIYREQTIAIVFDECGCAIKIDGKPVRIRTSGEALSIVAEEDGMYYVNGTKLFTNPQYVETLMKKAKKPHGAFADIFL